jgi:hypothetical protein
VRCGAVQARDLQCSAVQARDLQCSAVQSSAVQCSAGQRPAVQVQARDLAVEEECVNTVREIIAHFGGQFRAL